MHVLSFEEFIEETWDYVSENVVSDDYWEANEAFIRKVTHDLYKQYKKELIRLDTGEVLERLTTKICGRIMEDFFNSLIKFKYKK